MLRDLNYIHYRYDVAIMSNKLHDINKQALLDINKQEGIASARSYKKPKLNLIFDCLTRSVPPAFR